MKCPKCGAEARDVARFCQRCHATLRYSCPTCGHEQREGGVCEECGTNFLKYINAVVATKKVAADAAHDRFERRAGLLTGAISFPFTWISLIRRFFIGSNDR